MSPPLFLVSALPERDELTLDGAEGHHAAVVQRLRVGEALVVSDGQGGTASAVVVVFFVIVLALASLGATFPRLQTAKA